MTTFINLFGGPGAGKSIVAAELFASMKWAGYDCELVREYAKDLMWGDQRHCLNNQHVLLGEQARRMHLVDNKVEYAVTDSPLLMSVVYAGLYQDIGYYNNYFDMALDVHHGFRNVNIFVARSDEHYEPHGRSQSLERSKDIDRRIVDVLEACDAEVSTIRATPGCSLEIMRGLGLAR